MKSTKFGSVPRSPLWVLALASALLLSGCESSCGTSGPRVKVLFHDAAGLRGGEAVYFRGIRVGTTDAPQLDKDWAIVYVDLNKKARQGLPLCTEFVLHADPDQPQRLCLMGTAPDAADASASCIENVFPGHRSEGERLKSKAVDAWRDIKDFLGMH